MHKRPPNRSFFFVERQFLNPHYAPDALISHPFAPSYQREQGSSRLYANGDLAHNYFHIVMKKCGLAQVSELVDALACFTRTDTMS